MRTCLRADRHRQARAGKKEVYPLSEKDNKKRQKKARAKQDPKIEIVLPERQQTTSQTGKTKKPEHGCLKIVK